MFLFLLDLYYSVFELGASFSLFYLLISVVCAGLLTLAYRNVENGTAASLSNARKFTSINHKKLNLSREHAETLQSTITTQESQAWSFFVNNTVFIASFLFFAFYVLKSIDTP